VIFEVSEVRVAIENVNFEPFLYIIDDFSITLISVKHYQWLETYLDELADLIYPRLE